MITASAKKFRELCEKLELERNDLSYLGPMTKPQRKVATLAPVVIPERIKRVYFHAGRYSAGARDSMAVEAWLEYELAEEL